MTFKGNACQAYGWLELQADVGRTCPTAYLSFGSYNFVLTFPLHLCVVRNFIGWEVSFYDFILRIYMIVFIKNLLMKWWVTVSIWPLKEMHIKHMSDWNYRRAYSLEILLRTPLISFHLIEWCSTTLKSPPAARQYNHNTFVALIGKTRNRVDS